MRQCVKKRCRGVEGERERGGLESGLSCCSEPPLAAAAAAASAIPPFHWGSWPGCFETTAVPVERNTALIDIW